MTTNQTPEVPTVHALYINDNGRTVCEKHGGSYLSAEIEAHPSALIHFTPLGSWLRTTDPSPYGCETCGAIIPGADPEPADPRDTCPGVHVEAVEGEVYDWSWAGKAAQVRVKAVIDTDQRCQTVLVEPVDGDKQSFLTDTCLLTPTAAPGDPVDSPCEECGADAGEPCRAHCLARPEAEDPTS